MIEREPIFTAMLFNQCVNDQNLDKLADLMTENHKLICNGSVDTVDKQTSLYAWENFFKSYPDYVNHIVKIILKGNLVSLAGFSSCSEKILDGPALWRAKIEGNLISEWQVYEDNEDNRKKLGLI